MWWFAKQSPKKEESSLVTLRYEDGICQDTSKKLVRSLFTHEEPQQGLCPYASLPRYLSRYFKKIG